MNVNSSPDKAYIELLPEEIMYRHVFSYLKAEDIFTLGQCSQKNEKDSCRKHVASVGYTFTIYQNKKTIRFR